jgi:predicted CoA-binding protein
LQPALCDLPLSEEQVRSSTIQGSFGCLFSCAGASRLRRHVTPEGTNMHLRHEVLARYHTIAIVGMSPRPERASHEVAQYMQKHGYRIIPVNPAIAGQTVLGELCYASLTEASAALAKDNVDIEIVDCFRKSEEIGPIADEAIAIAANCLWMQLGVVNQAAADRAEQAGLIAVMDHCIKIEHMHALAAS